MLSSASKIIKENGRHPVNVSQNGKGNMTLVVEWKTANIAPEGILAFSVQNDPGRNFIKDLSGPRRIWITNFRPQAYDVDVSGLPDGAMFILHTW